LTTCPLQKRQELNVLRLREVIPETMTKKELTRLSKILCVLCVFFAPFAALKRLGRRARKGGAKFPLKI